MPFKLLFLLLAFHFLTVQCLTLKRQKPSQLNRKNEETNSAEKALNRTLAKLSTDGENGRFVLLVCRGKCLKERAQIPNWLREFNAANNRSILKRKNSNSSSNTDTDNRITRNEQNNSLGEFGTNDEFQLHFEGVEFHFYAHRLPILVMNIETALKRYSQRQSVLFYVVAGMAFPATAEAANREKNIFLNWLNSFEHPPIVRISGQDEMNEWLNSECHGDGLNKRRAKQQMALLVVHDQFLCPEPLLANFARSLSASSHQSHSPSLRVNVTVLEMLRPFAEDEELSLSARLPGLSRACRMNILLRANLFTELPQEIIGSKIHQIIELWLGLPLTTEQCPNGNSSLNLAQILGPLGTANLEFLREERILKAIEKKREYLAVGIIGGVAVMALAMSIFWGLNGNDFVTKP